eukprot:TRINITY_DN1641_c0_g3_i1.p1 TRINITY_DN1641_c0_g3~~TRINITY_DN1641_c0_g3_i1.p1  ORF type:complete len:204 (-),score=58.30 TRINITY_DN1641_c0_g3_i1:68-679(-)
MCIRDREQTQQEQQTGGEQQPNQVVEKKEKELPPGTVDDFAKIDIRVGKFVDVWKHPESDKLYCEKIDIGEGEIREIASGLQQFIKLEDMSGLCLVMVNLKPKKLGGFPSNGMVVCASNDDHTQVELLRPAEGSQVGERITLEGYDKITQERAAVLNPKHKILEKCFPLMKTDDDLNACFDTYKWATSTGQVKSSTLKNSSIS